MALKEKPSRHVPANGGLFWAGSSYKQKQGLCSLSYLRNNVVSDCQIAAFKRLIATVPDTLYVCILRALWQEVEVLNDHSSNSYRGSNVTTHQASSVWNVYLI